ncbi:MAG TPA: hypothetical protein VI386_16150 [Candidatus Sulfotelmatobacter sp.]
MPKQFYVYLTTNRTRSHVLYTGVTGNLSRQRFQEQISSGLHQSL